MTFKPDEQGFHALEQAIGEGLHRVVTEIVRDAQVNVPRLSGRTAASGFTVAYVNGREVASTGRHGQAADTANAYQGGGAVAYAGFSGSLAHLFETGTKARVQKSTHRATGRITPQPFLGPAAMRVGARAAAIIKGGS